jgi:uncharacterized protein YycO
MSARFPVRILPGDVVLFASNSILSKGLKFFQTKPNDHTVTWTNHVGIAVNELQLVEARKEVELNNLEQRAKEEPMMIARISSLNNRERELLAKYALKQIGKPYGYTKILGHLLDYYVSKFTGKDAYAFRKLLKSNRYPICSWVVAWAYSEVLGLEFNDVPPAYCQPDDIADDILIRNSTQWQLMYLHHKIKI